MQELDNSTIDRVHANLIYILDKTKLNIILFFLFHFSYIPPKLSEHVYESYFLLYFLSYNRERYPLSFNSFYCTSAWI